MSYILDALKKADRERNVEQVPTLSTVHAGHEAPRNHYWAISMATIVLLAVGLGFFIYLWDSRKQPEVGLQALVKPQDEAMMPDSGSTSSPTKAPAASSPELNRYNPPLDTSANKPSSLKLETGDIKTGTIPVPSPGAETSQSTAVRTESMRQPSALESGNTSLPENIQQSENISSESPNLPETLTQSPNIPSEASSLQTALESMKITILKYEKSSGSSLVFINGRKYVEGDYVDGIYLIEKITRDSVILSHEGVQEILKPESN